jgi:RNA polymerase sigma-70 factor (ECF subfamily)
MENVEEAIESHKHQVFTFAYRFLGDRAEAEDVTQEVLVRLWKHHAALEHERVKAWLIRVTRNACLDVARKRKRHRAVGDRGGYENAIDTVASDGPHPESALVLSEVGKQVKDALDDLAEPYKTVVVLREIQGMTYDEVSQALEMPLNTVKVYLHRGRRKLRDALRGRRADGAL